MRAKKTDANQKQIVAELRQLGYSVMDCSTVGRGFPDLVIGYNNKNYLIEIKTKVGKLNDLQVQFAINWRGQIAVARTTEQIIKLLTGDNG